MFKKYFTPIGLVLIILAVLAAVFVPQMAQASQRPTAPTKEKIHMTDKPISRLPQANTPVGDVYAFAVQPTFEKTTSTAVPPVTTTTTAPGYVQLNPVTGGQWHLDGSLAEPGKYVYQGGAQVDAYVTAKPGYQIASNVVGSEANPIYMQVNPQRFS